MYGAKRKMDGNSKKLHIREEKTRIALFSRISFLSIILVVFFRFAGFRVYYLTTQTVFNSDSFRRIAKNLGVLHLSYDDFRIENPQQKIDSYVNQVSLEFGNNLATKSLLFLDANKRAGGGKGEIKSFGILVSQYFNSLAIESSEISLFCNAIYDRDRIKPVLFCKKSCISDRVLELSGCNCKNLEPRLFLVLEYLSVFFYRLAYYFVHAFRMFKYPVFQSREGENTENMCKPIDLERFSVAFLPHQGPFYDSFFKKDQYYSSDKESPFFPGNVLHLLYKDDDNLLEKTISYYKSNNIPFIDFFHLKTLKLDLVKDTLWFLSTFLKKKYRSDADFFMFLSVFMALYSARDSVLRLKEIPNLKLMLYGYDVLFPKSISYGCRVLNITTVASQERNFFPWGESSLIVDHYFSIGPASDKRIQINARYDVGSSYVVGSPRLDDIYSQFCTISSRKKILNDCKLLSIVFDFHSSVDKYDNERSYNNNWRSNCEFYSVIIDMAKHFPEVMFLIKGKNSDFLRIPFFAKVVNEINKIKNICVVTDQGTVSPYYYAAICDFAIAIYTSIADEIMQSNKPVILYDGLGKGIPNPDIGFDDNTVSRSRMDLAEKINLVADGNYKSSSSSEIHKIAIGSVKSKIRKKLVNIYNEA